MKKRLLSIIAIAALVVAMVPNMVFAASAITVSTESELKTALTNIDDGGTITLSADIELTSTLNINNGKSFTIDGDGHKITKNGSETNTAFMVGDTGYMSDSAGSYTYTLKNLVFDGWDTNHVVRVQGVTVVIDGCTFQNCNQPGGDAGIITLNYSNAVVKNCVFKNNTCFKCIDINSWADGSNTEVTIEKCTFTENEATAVGTIYYHDGGKCEVTECEFTKNDCAIAPVFMGLAGGDATVSHCTLNGNEGGNVDGLFVEGACEVKNVTGGEIAASAKNGDKYYGFVENAIADAKEGDTLTILNISDTEKNKDFNTGGKNINIVNKTEDAIKVNGEEVEPYVEPTPAPEQKPEEKPAAKPDKSPNTGDNSMAPFAAAGLALAAMAAVAATRRREN